MGVIALGRSSVGCGADGVCRSTSRMAGRRVDSARRESATARQFRGGGEEVSAFFASEPPQTSAGMIAPPRARPRTRRGGSTRGQRSFARCGATSDFDHSTETLILREFGAAYSQGPTTNIAPTACFMPRVSSPPCVRPALAGTDIAALTRARIAAARGQLTPALGTAVPPALRNDPGRLLFARIQDARRSSNRAYEGGDAASISGRRVISTVLINSTVGGANGWKVIAGELLDLDEPRPATFELCDNVVRPRRFRQP